MILGENIGSVYSNGREIQRVFSKGKLVWEKGDIDYSVTPFTVKAIDGGASVWVGKINPDNGKTIYIDIKYSINGGEWVTTNSRNTIKLNINDRVSIIANDADFCTVRGDSRWEGMQEIYALSDIYGNIMSLIYGDDFIGQTVWKKRTYFFANSGFFSQCDIRNANNLILPATSLTEKSYKWMFDNCYYLTSAPETLPASSLKKECYYEMYRGCANLTTSSDLPAQTLVDDCYYGMYAYCEKLSHIKCSAIENVNKDTVGGWTTGVSSTGTLVCKRIDGGKNPLEDYIPDTWTVEYMD